LLAGALTLAVQAAPPGQEPAGKPSAARGELVWIENCAPCHGNQGRGDGETAQAPQMANNPPTDFTDLAAARQRTPEDMFRVVKEGRMDRMMPPWGGRLSDEQIWDVVAYSQSFATSPADVAAGKAVYEANCVECHAADGTGAVPGASDLNATAALAAQSPQALFDAVSQGQGEMPGFAGQLSEAERWQVVDYVRAFGYEPIAATGVISGQVRNATTGQLVGDVEVKLRRWGIDSEMPPLTAQADADGKFRFEGLDTRSHSFYSAEVTRNGVAFPSEFVSFESGRAELSLPINVYEAADSDEAIRLERLHFIVFGDQPGFFTVLELYQFSNQGDRAYVGSLDQDGVRQTVRMALPAGAQDLSLQRGALGVDFVETDDGLVATSIVVPGQNTFEAAFVYALPYSGAELSLDRPLYYDTASINALVLDMGAKLDSAALSFGGERTAQGQTFLQYDGQDLKAGQTLPIRLYELDKVEFTGASETPAEESAVMPSTAVKQATLLWLMLGLGALALIFVAFYPRLRARLRGEVLVGQADLARERQRLLLTLARLDQAYEAGQLNEPVYRRARARRKAELADVLRRMQEEAL